MKIIERIKNLFKDKKIERILELEDTNDRLLYEKSISDMRLSDAIKENAELKKEKEKSILEINELTVQLQDKQETTQPEPELTNEQIEALLKEEAAKEEDILNGIMAQVVIQLNNTNDVNIMIHWREETQELANNLSQMLAGLCTDRGIEVIAAILVSHMRQNADSEPFVNQVLNGIYKAKNTPNAPVIDPLAVFHRGQQ